MAERLSHSRKPPFLFLLGLLSIFCLWGTAESVIGVSWGRQSAHRMVPSMVVDLLLQNGVHHLKVFSPSRNVMKAFARSNIVVTLSMPNLMLPAMKIPGMAKFWLNEYVRQFRNLGVDIRYIIIGTDPAKGADPAYYDTTIEAFTYTQEAIRINRHDYLTPMLQHSNLMLNSNITKPSEADFTPEYKEKITKYLKLINGTKSPFVVNMFPYQIVQGNGWDEEFAFVDNKSGFTIEDNGHVYGNVFEFIIDSFIVALTKAGAPDIEIVVGAIGWATDGVPTANLTNAERFFRSFLPYIKSDKGTPLRPGVSMDCYIQSLTDEALQRVDGKTGFNRHWGIYKANGQPKFKIDLSGQGRDIYPTRAKGTVAMPKRWCVLNPEKATNISKVQEQFDFACAWADCTSLFPGGSCSDLNFYQNASFAFNNYFQLNAQYGEESTSCNFDGLGMVIPKDPSLEKCEFQVEILQAEKADSEGVSSSTRIGSRLQWILGSMVVLLSLIFQCAWFEL